MTSGNPSLPRSKRITIGTKEKPPRQDPGGEKKRTVSASTLQGVATFSILDRGRDLETHLLSEHTGNETAYRVSLPASGFHEIGPGGAGRALQQIEDLGRFATFPGTLPVLGRLCAHVGFLRRGGLLSRLAFGGRRVPRLCANTPAFRRGRLGGRGGNLGVRGLFWNFVHCVFSLSGDDRDHIHRSDSRRLQANSDANRHRLSIAHENFRARVGKGGGGW